MGWEAIAAFLGSCQSPDGGFGGGPQQLPHLAPTYAALAALTDLGDSRALAVVDRRGVASFIERMAVPPEQGGGFRVCDGASCTSRMVGERMKTVMQAGCISRSVTAGGLVMGI